ncbi:MAG: hypothetical protein ABFR90_04460 [Planctomycetota bacterium]
MQVKYYTSKGSIYVHEIAGENEFWFKQDTHGDIHPLIGGIHISRKRLQELVSEYPSTLLDKTYCFDVGVEQEFFEDAKREAYPDRIHGDETIICFLIKRNSNCYAIGCSSLVQKIEKIE